ncbi:hypothetical protein AMS68_006862 [Peltaster fructicola]|uniref:Helicase ATP-binding domain-containing protein n=1 Tax=Peltaster fructicola TaxID=286661 RepID=A0A6H0Y343_9PEZI|nr:hypothetical protein AMS68_006862 [Peltaster fructicola]
MLQTWLTSRTYLTASLAHRVSAITSRQYAVQALSSEPTSPPPKIELRDYQQQSIASVIEYLSRGERRLGLSLATGSGKTVVFSHLIDRVPSPTPEATRTLVLAHRRELVEQAARHCRDVYPNKTLEIEMGKMNASGTADITVASVATIGRRLEKYNPATFKLIIVDEAHHITAPSYTSITSWFGLDGKMGEASPGHVALVGVSATFSRADGISLGSAIDHIVYHKDYLEMIDDDYLSGLIITTVQTGVDLSQVKLSKGDFTTGSLSKAVNTEASNALTVRSWLSKAEGRHSTLVFCVDIAHVQYMTAEFRKHGIDARMITGDTKTDLRSETLLAFKNAEFPVLVNCGIFTEGTDIPNIDCILLARPTKSRNLLIQMIGRGLRKHASKTNCHIIDMVGALQNGIVTAPTLFGLDPYEVLEGADKKQMEEVKEKQVREQTSTLPPTNVSFTDYDNVLDFIQDTAGERRIRALSSFAWVEADSNRYYLGNHNGDYLTIQHIDSKFRVLITRKLIGSKAPYMTPRLVAEATTRESAIAAADTYASNNFAHSYIMRWASWRRAPASDGQLKFLNKFRPEDEQLKPESVSKGEASDWITKLKHGAKGRFQRGVKQSQKLEQAKMQEASRARVGMQGPIL